MGQANQGKKINSYSEIDAMANDSTFVVLQKINGIRKVRQFTKEKFLEQFQVEIIEPISLTYAQLTTLATASELIPMMWYKITNATSASFNLYVQAVAVNAIGCDAKDPLYPNDVVKYNFASNEVYEVEVNSYASFVKYSALASVLKIGFGASEIDLTTNTINLTSNREYFFNNTTLIHTTQTIKFISAVNIENFAINGKLNIIGTKLTNETNQQESGLYLKNCKNYFVDGVVVKNCRFCGIELDAPDEYLPNERGDRGKFSNISLNSNNYPIYIAPLAEYNVFTNITASSNLNAFLVQGGNNNFSVCNIVDNQKGVWVLGGANDAHGVFSGCNINHNTEYNLLVEDIVNGETFVGCHFYGNDAEGAGMIKIQNSRGVNIQSGIIDAAIMIVTEEDGRCHSISNNFIAGSYTSISGDFLENIFRKNNFTISGQWASNN